MLLRAARFEVARRRSTLLHLRGNELDDIANEAADDALMSVLRRLDDFRGASRFTTWAYKFALLEAAVKLKKARLAGARDPTRERRRLGPLLESRASSRTPRPSRTSSSPRCRARSGRSTPHQRSVLVALAVNGIPIDILAERLNTNRGALYKTLHDARRKLRKHLTECGLALDGWLEED